jgi:hypothetical protein
MFTGLPAHSHHLKRSVDLRETSLSFRTSRTHDLDRYRWPLLVMFLIDFYWGGSIISVDL